MKLKFKLKGTSSQSTANATANVLVDNLNLNLKSNLPWTEKYRPKFLHNIIGNQKQILLAKQWLEDLRDPLKQSKTQRALLLSGPPGTSKTTVAHSLLNEYNYKVREFNASDIRTKTMIINNFGLALNSERVDKNTIGYKPTGIVMDEVDGISSGDKSGITELIKILNTTKIPKLTTTNSKKTKNISVSYNKNICPIICICNNNTDKKMKDLKKNCFEIVFEKPTEKDLLSVAQYILKNEGIIDKMDNFAITNIIQLSQYDYRKMILLLQQFVEANCYTLSDTVGMLPCLMKKNIDLLAKDVCQKIFCKSKVISDVIRYYETDKILLPMLVHENYLDMINSQHLEEKEYIDVTHECINDIIDGDRIEKFIHNTQGWHLQTVHGICSCYMPNYHANIKQTTSRPYAEWTSAFSKYSSQRANIKLLYALSFSFCGDTRYQIVDTYLLCKLILHYIFGTNGNDGDKHMAINYMKNYNLSINDIEKLLKINKLENKYKNIYTPTIKKRLLEEFKTLVSKEPARVSAKMDGFNIKTADIFDDELD